MVLKMKDKIALTGVTLITLVLEEDQQLMSAI
jgi:hypothetical protein